MNRDPAERYLSSRGRRVERALRNWLNRIAIRPPRLRRAMAHSLFAKAKRLRPSLALAACESVGGRAAAVVPFACALELVHTYSLVHDDLPAMDDDPWRRGRPASHVAYDEATAILVGDALLTMAFEVLARTAVARGAPWPAATLELAAAAGPSGMVAGQAIDLAATARVLSPARLRQLHRLKTGALIRASIRGGALLGRANPTQLRALTAYADNVGLAFQIADDLLDIRGGRELGKTPGKDQRRRKATYPRLIGEQRSRERMLKLTGAAVHALRPLGSAAAALEHLARYVIARAR
ncbi:MAG TPA: farnesyl diphosphate synthase [Acidobacteriota bacterium]